MNNFVKGLLLTGLVPVVAGIVSAVVVRGSTDEGVQITFGMMWLGALLVFIVTLIAGLVSGRSRRRMAGRACRLASAWGFLPWGRAALR